MTVRGLKNNMRPIRACGRGTHPASPRGCGKRQCLELLKGTGHTLVYHTHDPAAPRVAGPTSRPSSQPGARCTCAS